MYEWKPFSRPMRKYVCHVLVFSRVVLNVSIKQVESSFSNQELRQSTIVGMGSTTLDIQKPPNFPRTQVCPSHDWVSSSLIIQSDFKFVTIGFHLGLK